MANGASLREVCVEAKVLIERERRIHTVSFIGTDAAGRCCSMRVHRADAAPPQDVVSGAKRRKIRGGRTMRVLVSSLNIERPKRECAGSAGQSAARLKRRQASAIETNAAREEEIRRIAGACPNSGAHAAGKRKDAESLEKEIALLRKEQVETCQVHLLLIDFHLREVRLEREISRQIFIDAVFHISANAGLTIVSLRNRSSVVGRDTQERIWLHFQITRRGRRLQSDERRRG